MKLYYFGHQMVSQQVYPLVESVDQITSLRREMIGMMQRHGFNGLSAPQVGFLLQYSLVKLEDGSILDLVNPRITKMYGVEVEMPESCISCPPYNNSCKVSRMQIIHVNHGLQPIEERFKGANSRVIQHEIDHLQGTFFFQRASIRDRTVVIDRFKEWKHNWKLNNEKEKHDGNDGSKTPTPHKEVST